MQNQKFDKPLFIIGAARSGTTLLGELMSHHPDIAYWLEPKYIWRYGNASAKSDLRDESQASYKVINYIRTKFSDFLYANNKSRLLEKTPSNVFRIPFILKVFPSAHFIYIVRDGRDVMLSAESKWTSKPDRSALIRRLVSWEIPLREWSKYLYGFLRDVPGRLLFPKRGFIWGPYFEGIQEYRNSHSILETCTKQWLESVKTAEKGLNKVPKSQVLKIKYEDLVSQPESVLMKIFEFSSLEYDNKVWRAKFKHIKPRKAYTEEEKEKINKIYPMIEDKLHDLGY